LEQIEKIIGNLINSKKEGNYWDFKEIPHNNNADLLHDILCLANAKHKGDRFLILGVSDPSSGANIVGLTTGMVDRKTQQQFIDFLNRKDFGGGIKPDISLHTLTIDKKQIDVLQITNHPYKPYYLTSTYTIGRRNVRANHIYTRIGDTNTPIDSSADLLHIEHMWRERFHLDVHPKEKMLHLLSDPSEWTMDLGNSEYAYNNNHPEYKIEFSQPKKVESAEAYCYFYPNPVAYLGTAKFYYQSTLLLEQEYMTCDEMRRHLPVPQVAYVSKNGIEGWYYYFTKNAISGLFLKFLTRGTYSFSSGRGSEPPFLIFKDEMESKAFEDHVNQHLDDIIKLIPTTFAKMAKREKENANDTTPIDPIFMDQIHQYYASFQSGKI